MTTTILLFIAGLVILIVGADLLVRGASRLAACHWAYHRGDWYRFA